MGYFPLFLSRRSSKYSHVGDTLLDTARTGPYDSHARRGPTAQAPSMTPKTARAVLVAISAFALIGAGFWLHAFAWGPRATPPPPSSSSAGGTEALQSGFVRVAERVRPAVVHIGTVQVARTRRPPVVPGPLGDAPFFKDLFDQF